MPQYLLKYEFPLGSGTYITKHWHANSEQHAKQSYGINNPTLTATLYTPPVLHRNKKATHTLTNAPCTAKCWHAEEDVCRCSCGGKHHGIGYNPADAPQPKEASSCTTA